MKTLTGVRREITRISNIDVEGFDNDWVLRKFARDQALIHIALIKPYTDKYALIVRFLVTGKDADAASVAAVYAEAAAYNDAAADTAACAATVAATDTVAATYTAYAAATIAAAYATDAGADYTKAIASLRTLANEYLAFLAKEGE